MLHVHLQEARADWKDFVLQKDNEATAGHIGGSRKGARGTKRKHVLAPDSELSAVKPRKLEAEFDSDSQEPEEPVKKEEEGEDAESCKEEEHESNDGGDAAEDSASEASEDKDLFQGRFALPARSTPCTPAPRAKSLLNHGPDSSATEPRSAAANTEASKAALTPKAEEDKSTLRTLDEALTELLPTQLSQIFVGILSVFAHMFFYIHAMTSKDGFLVVSSHFGARGFEKPSGGC